MGKERLIGNSMKKEEIIVALDKLSILLGGVELEEFSFGMHMGLVESSFMHLSTDGRLLGTYQWDGSDWILFKCKEL